MSILIDNIRINGFRGIMNIEIPLSRITVLIGTNNSGKTSVLKAMQLALGDYSHFLTEEDFHIGEDEKRIQEILVDVRIVPVNTVGTRIQQFSDNWAAEFGDKIKAEANGNQFVSIRTRAIPDLLKGDFGCKRFTLEKWPEFNVWMTEKVKESKLTARFDSLPVISIDAQRDIYQDLKEKSSFVGKVLSSIVYIKSDIDNLEGLIKDVNDKAVAKSNELQNLIAHLDKLNTSFNGSGCTEITPFPKKIRDLSKHFSIQFGENSGNSFSMEYHGMGTRSWASMLTVRAFTDLKRVKHAEDEKQYYPILTLEEPEAHLHPNAQKTIYSQLMEIKGQVIISTHSPYLAAMADQSELRYLQKESGCIKVQQLSLKQGTDDYRRLQREVIHSRGELLFSNALVLCEGETEEQALPILFKKYFELGSFELGVNFIGVGGSGKKFLPFLTFAHDFNIPVFIFSDGETKTISNLEKIYCEVFGQIDISCCHNITILNGTDFEGYLLEAGYQTEIEAAINEIDGSDHIDKWIQKKHGTSEGRVETDSPPCTTCNQHIFADVIRNYKATDGRKKAILDILNSNKTRYAPAIAKQLCELNLEKLPPKIIDLFIKIKDGALS